MTLPSSPPITAQDINIELGRAATAAFSITGSAERGLAGIPSGSISLSDFLGKSHFVVAKQGTTHGTGPSVSSVPFGAADSGRRVLVAISVWGSITSGSPFSSVTIGGVAATIHAQENAAGTSHGVAVCIASAAVPSGTSGIVSWTGPNTSECEVTSFRCLGMSSTAYDSGADVYNDTTGGGGANGTASTSLDLPAGGVLVGAAAASAAGSFSPASFNWSGATATYNAQESNNELMSHSFDTGLSAATGHAVSASVTTGSPYQKGVILAIASFASA